MDRPITGARYLCFEDFRVDRKTRELYRGGRRLPIQDKPWQLLEALLLAENDVVSREQLAAKLWPDQAFVDYESGINTAVRKLREILGDSAATPRFIETLPRVGYRCLVTAEAQAMPDGPRIRSRALPGRPAVAGAILMTVVAVGATLWFWAGERHSPATVGDQAPSMPASAEEADPLLPQDPRARQAFREARFLLTQKSQPEGPSAVELLKRVCRLAPDFAPAYGYLAKALAYQASDSGSDCETCLEHSRAAARTALVLDPDQGQALLAQARISLLFDWDREAAGESARRAVTQAPTSAEAQMAWGAWLAATGRAEDSLEAVKRAMDLEPESYTVRSDLGFFLLGTGRTEEAAKACRRAAELSPQFLPAHRCSLLAHHLQGDRARAIADARTVMTLSGASIQELADFEALSDAERVAGFWRWNLQRELAETPRSPLRIAAAYAVLDHKAEALQWLERGWQERQPELAFVHTQAEFHALLDEPRFLSLVERIGVLDSRVTAFSGARDSHFGRSHRG